MNYASFIVKIIHKSNFSEINPVTEIAVQMPQFKNDDAKIIMYVSVWGKLGYDMTQYYQVNDYVIIEGYVSIREDQSTQQIPKTSKRIEMSLYKVYPFSLDVENRITEY